MPARLGILMRFEASTTRLFEVDLILEKDGSFAQELGDRVE